MSDFLLCIPSEGSYSNPRPGRNYYSLGIRFYTSSNDVALKATVL